MTRLLARAIAIVAVALFASGCSLLGGAGEGRRFEDVVIVAGTVRVSEDYPRAAVIVAAIDVHTGEVEQHVRLSEPGPYALMVRRCQYRVIAFLDNRANGVLDDAEPAGSSAGQVDVTHEGSLIGAVDIDVAPATAIGREDRRRLLKLSRAAGTPRPTGVRSSMDAPQLSAAAGRIGYWNPVAAFRKHGAAIHLIEPYDPGRTPILFVHGAGGSPQDWRAMLETLDTTRYQAWLFQYPSGASLALMGDVLQWQLAELRQRHHVAELHVVAHSMGGLVVRSFLARHGDEFPEIATFVSLSTPWGGVSTATLGVRLSPWVLPSWVDLQPDGEFLRSTLAMRLPHSIRHYLYFGHRSAGLVHFLANDDGVVTLASQLDRRAQRGAYEVAGFDENHESILRSPAVISSVFAALRGGRRFDEERLAVD